MKSPSSILLFLLLMAVFTAMVAHTAEVKSPTWDEVGYFGLGTYLLKTWRWDVAAAASHPPLAYFLHGLPLLFRSFPVDIELWQAPLHLATDLAYLRSADLQRGNTLLLDPSLGEGSFFTSRLMSLALAVPLFASLGVWARQMAGSRWPITVGLAALSPNLIAHSALITTDLAITASFFIAVFALQQLVRQPNPGRLVLAGWTVGLALLSKLSALLIFPAGFLAAAWHKAFHPEGLRSSSQVARIPGWMDSFAGAVAVAIIALVVVWVGYGFQLAPYFSVLKSQLWDLESGHQSYLMGEISSQGWWYYFPVAMAIKTPLPVLVLATAGLWNIVRHRNRCDLAFTVVPPLVFLLAFVVAGNAKNIGLRYLLPVYPFFFLWASQAFLDTPRSRHARARWPRAVVVSLMTWMVISTLHIHPHHLAYFNELVGGPENGRRYLVDSNLDWGQDLKGLKQYCDDRGLERIKLSYFGSVDPALYDLEYDWLPSYQLPVRGKTHIELPTTGTIAISVTNLAGVYMDLYGHGTDLFRWLDKYQPVAHIGYSILVFDVLPENPRH